MTTEIICRVPGCNKVALFPTEPPSGHGKLACLEHWEEFEKWKTDRDF